MRATRAYIASAGTAVVMLGASLCVFVVVSAFVAFGSWPGAQAHENVDQVLLRDVVAKAKPKKVAVRSDAVVVARRTAERADRRAARHPGQVLARTPAGTPVAQAPVKGVAPPASSAPAASTPPSSPAAPVQQQAQDVTKTVDNTTTKVTTPVQQQVQNVQNQVNEVVGGIGAPATGGDGNVVNDVTNGVNNVTTGVTNGVKDTTGSLLGG
ncbi:MAG: hypothetical protein ACJ77Z_03615 [Thermoleophilaceae bacterium]